MSDDLLFYTAVFVFSLMALGLLLTVIEFRSLRRRSMGDDLRDMKSAMGKYVEALMAQTDTPGDMQPVAVRSNYETRRRM